MSDLTGQTLDRYEIAELIGEGGMATVYRARQPRLERDVAIKVMLPTLAANPIFRERFEREARAIANLRHPNILTVYDYGETGDGQLYLVVDFVRRGTLRQRLGGGALPWKEAIEIAAQVAEALDYAHGRGVIHRDVKPNNILLTQEGRPLLADFGLVKPIQADRRLTSSGVMLGTPDYVAPEQAQGLETDGRADIYALGVMLFEMLTGQHPYAGETPVSIILKHINDPIPRLSEVNPAAPAALDEIVARATAKSPNERYQRAGEMARALRTALVSDATPQVAEAWATVPSAAPATTPPQTPTPDSPAATPVVTSPPVLRPWYQQGRVWVVLVAILALVMVAAFVLPSVLSGERETQTGAVPTAQPGEVMILIAEFKAEAGSERYDVSQRIYDKLAADLRRLGETDVTVYQLPDVIESSEAAVDLGQKYGATTVIWGYYDDIGISPNVEAVGALEESQLSVGLERLNLDAGEAVNFKLYIAKGLPEELSFLTAISLLQAYSVQGRMEKAVLYTVMAAENLPEDIQFRGGGETIYYIQAMIAFFQGDMEGAVEYMDQAIAIAPDGASLYALRGGIYAQMGQTERAMADLEQAIALDPNSIMGYAMQAYAAWAVGDLETALTAYDHIVELEPDEWMGYWAQSTLYFEMGDPKMALAAWEQVEKLDPDNQLLPLARGLIYEKMGHTSLAMANFDQAKGLAVSSDVVSQFLRVSLSDQAPVLAYFPLLECTDYQIHGRIQEALEKCNEALESDPTYANALWKRGQLLMAQEELELALADFSAAIEADPSWPWVYYLRAQALAKLGRADEVQADLARALELDPVDELRQQIEHFDVYGK